MGKHAKIVETEHWAEKNNGALAEEYDRFADYATYLVRHRKENDE